MTLYYLNQYVTVHLSKVGGLNDSDTTGIVLDSDDGVETAKPGLALLTYQDPLDTATAEWITYTSISVGKELQGVTRAQEGSSAKAHDDGCTIAFPISRSHINNLNDQFETAGSGFKQISTPSSPSSGRNKLYFKSDEKLYKLTSGGTETEVGGASSPWIQDTNTWTRTGNHTFTISGDYTTTYTKGTKIRYKDGGSYEYGTVKSSSYGAPNTTVTLAENTDYAMASATITDTYYSYSFPSDFPGIFNFTSSPTGYSGSPTINNASFYTKGRECTMHLDITGTSNATTLTVTNPFDRSGLQYLYQSVDYVQDNSATQTSPGQAEIQSNTTINFYKTLAQGAFTSSGTKRIICTLVFNF